MAQLGYAENADGSFNGSLRLKIGGEDVEVHQIEMGDIADAEGAIRGERITALMSQPGFKTLDPAVQGKALGDVCNHPISFQDILNTYTGRMHLLLASVNKGRQQRFTAATLRAQLGPLSLETLGQILLAMTGVSGTGDKNEPQADPTLSGSLAATSGAR
jgi:hypothetical protein